jgi:DNA-binding transcriptional regulator YiaG
LRQKDVAERLGVNQDTIRNWEVGRAAPALWQWPAIVRFLGYVPFSTDGGLSERLKTYRRLHGLSQRRLAAILGVDPMTVGHWEQGASRPNAAYLDRIS